MLYDKFVTTDRAVVNDRAVTTDRVIKLIYIFRKFL